MICFHSYKTSNQTLIHFTVAVPIDNLSNIFKVSAFGCSGLNHLYSKHVSSLFHGKSALRCTALLEQERRNQTLAVNQLFHILWPMFCGVEEFSFGYFAKPHYFCEIVLHLFIIFPNFYNKKQVVSFLLVCTYMF